MLTGEEAEPIAQLLVEYGARCDIEDKSGSSAISIVQGLMLRYSSATNLNLYCKYQALLETMWENHGESRC